MCATHRPRHVRHSGEEFSLKKKERSETKERHRKPHIVSPSTHVDTHSREQKRKKESKKERKEARRGNTKEKTKESGSYVYSTGLAPEKERGMPKGLLCNSHRIWVI